MNSCLFFAFKIFLFINTHKLPLINVRNFNFACFMAKFIIIFIFLWVFFFFFEDFFGFTCLVDVAEKKDTWSSLCFVCFFFYIYFFLILQCFAVLHSCTWARATPCLKMVRFLFILVFFMLRISTLRENWWAAAAGQRQSSTVSQWDDTRGV